MEYSQLEKKINSILAKIGTQSFMRYLNKFERNYDYKSDNQYKIIKGIILQYFNIREHELYNDHQSTIPANARKTMVFLLKQCTLFENNEIREYLSISRQAYSKYLKNIDDAIQNKSINPELNKAIEETNNIFHTKNNQKWKLIKKQKQ